MEKSGLEECTDNPTRNFTSLHNVICLRIFLRSFQNSILTFESETISKSIFLIMSYKLIFLSEPSYYIHLYYLNSSIN
jgi:hypothetical protein